MGGNKITGEVDPAQWDVGGNHITVEPAADSVHIVKGVENVSEGASNRVFEIWL